MLPLKNIFEPLISLALPPVCICCGEPTETADSFYCQTCKDKLVRAEGYNLNSGYIDNFISLYEFREGNEIQTIIHALKYKRKSRIGIELGIEAGNVIMSLNNVKYDYVIPVPLHIAKKRERTFNQSDKICKGISISMKIPFLPKGLKRVKWTESQTHLNLDARITNVHNAFRIRDKYKEMLKNKNIILADDVITTGSTISECAKVLKENGCRLITACSIAKAV